MKPNSKGLIWIAVAGYLAIAALIAVVATPAPTGGKAAWYSIHSWGKHKPADTFDKAKIADVKAAALVDQKSDALVHAAAIEIDKAKDALPSLPPSPATDVVRRTVDNAAGALNQVSPLTVSETQANYAVVLGLLSTETAKRATAEAQERAAETALAAKSADLIKAEAAAKIASDKLETASASLRTAFEARNALANELEAGKVKRNAIIALAVIFLLVAWYFKTQLAGVGEAFHGFDAESFHNIATAVERKTSSVGQWFIHGGRLAAAKAEAILVAKAKSTDSPPISPQPTAPAESIPVTALPVT